MTLIEWIDLKTSHWGLTDSGLRFWASDFTTQVSKILYGVPRRYSRIDGE